MSAVKTQEIITDYIYQSDVKITCKCGNPMDFNYYEFAYSQFKCTKCNAVFVHDDWNEPNPKRLGDDRSRREYNKKVKEWYW